MPNGGGTPAAEAPPKPGIFLPAALPLFDVIYMLQKGEVRKLFRQLKSVYGHTIDEFTVGNIYDLLYQFGLIAPLGEFHPPVGAVEKHTNIFIDLTPAQTKKIKVLCGPVGEGQQNLIAKYREIVLSPLDPTSEDSVRVAQKISGPQFDLAWWSNAACFNEGVGDFSTFQNLIVPFKHYIEFEIQNTDRNSNARMHLEAISWLA